MSDLVVKISADISLDEFKSFCELWEANDFASYKMPSSLSEESWRHLYGVSLQLLPAEFAFALLAELAESDIAPHELLREIFQKGDIGCKETVCLRDDLNDEMKALCCQYDAVHTPPWCGSQ